MPKVVTQRCLKQNLNPRPTDRKPKCLTRCTTAHWLTEVYSVFCLHVGFRTWSKWNVRFPTCSHSLTYMCIRFRKDICPSRYNAPGHLLLEQSGDCRVGIKIVCGFICRGTVWWGSLYSCLQMRRAYTPFIFIVCCDRPLPGVCAHVSANRSACQEFCVRTGARLS